MQLGREVREDQAEDPAELGLSSVAEMYRHLLEKVRDLSAIGQKRKLPEL